MTAQEYEADFLANIKEKTGQLLGYWMKAVGEQKLDKPKPITDWLKTAKGLNHAHASLLADIFLNGGKPKYGNTTELMDALFKGKNEMQKLFKVFEGEAKKQVKNIQFLPTKTYVSIRATKEFAVASIKSKEIRIGLDLGKVPFNSYLQPSKSLGAMPRFTHMVTLQMSSDVNKDLMKYFKDAFNRLHQ